MMFIEEVTKVNNLVFAHQAELKKAKYDKIELWDTGWQHIKIEAPTENNSTATINDIKTMQILSKKVTPTVKKQYVDCDLDGSYYVKLYMEDNDLEFNNDIIEFIEDQCRPVIRHFKNFFNRPRPYQLTKALNMDLDRYITKTSNTPSYPSGHAVQSRVVANYYATLYPEHKEGLLKGAYICGWGRVEAGLHYPSDYTAGVKLADSLMNHMRVDKLNEDAPVNATGSGISMPPTMQKKKKEQDKRFYELWKRKPKT
mgnify:FL=1